VPRISGGARSPSFSAPRINNPVQSAPRIGASPITPGRGGAVNPGAILNPGRGNAVNPGAITNPGRGSAVNPGAVIGSGRGNVINPGAITNPGRGSVVNPGAALGSGRGNAVNPGAVLNGGRGNALNPGAITNPGRDGNPLRNTPNLGLGNRDPIGRNLNNTLNSTNRSLNNSVGRALDNATGSRVTNFRPGLNGNSLRGLPYSGNTLRAGNQKINFAANNYRPSYNRYPWYHGYWNGGRYGGNGYGWGYGNRGYGYGGLGYGRFGYGGFGLAGFGNPWYGGGYGGGYGYGGYGGYGYGGYYPLGWGLGGWGLGSLLYGSGYLPYSNPYYGGYGGNSYAVYDYSQPIPVAYASDTSVQTPIVDDASGPAPTALDQAVSAFKQGNYDASLDIVDKAIQKTPSDAVLHEFRALVLFARGDYQQAASTIHSVLAVGPGWDWTTLSSLYDDVDVYTAQLRALENYTVAHPQDAAGEFLLAYHYLSAGHADAARKELEIVARLQPNDRVASDLLKMLSPKPADDANQGLAQAPQPNGSQPLPPPAPPAGAPAADQSGASDTAPAGEQDPFPATGPAIDPAKLAGNWTATRNDGSSFQLQLTPDSKFTWTFQNKQAAPQTFDGTYSVKGNVLTLERKEGGSMVVEVASADAQKFHFKLYGAEDDPGLNFQKR